MSYTNAAQLARALQVYNNQVHGSSTRINDVLAKTGLRKGSFDAIFPTMFSIHSKDIKNSLNIALSNGLIDDKELAILLMAYEITIKKLSEELEVITESEIKFIISELDRFTQTFNSNINAGTVSSKVMLQLELILESIQREFARPRVVYYIPSTKDSIGSIKILSYSFKNLRDFVNTRVKKNLDIELVKVNMLNSKIADDSYLTTKLVNYGHTLIEADGKQQLLTSKLISTLISLGDSLTEDRAKLISADFVEYTKQNNTKIVMHHGIDARGEIVFNLVVNSGYFQATVVQSVAENQLELSKLEKAWGLLNRDGLLKSLGFSNVKSLISNLLKVKASPSVQDKLGTHIANAILGKKLVPKVDTKVLLNETKNSKRIAINTKVTRAEKLSSSKVPGINRVSPGVSVANLESLLRSRLSMQVKENMGTGNAKNVLNYRTGRFAESATIERVSQSRAGMVTAFYSYMRHPYGTFSEGGQQQFPKSRDPKLLISKSIRQIGAALVGNRMRAVLV